MGAKESQNVSFFAGDRIALRYPIADATGLAPAALTTPVGYFKMAGTLDGAPVLSKSSPDSGASIVQEPREPAVLAAGVLTIKQLIQPQ